MNVPPSLLRPCGRMRCDGSYETEKPTRPNPTMTFAIVATVITVTALLFLAWVGE